MLSCLEKGSYTRTWYLDTAGMKQSNLYFVNGVVMFFAWLVQSADSLLKLVSELKKTTIFSGFASLNDHVEQRTAEFNQQVEKTDRLLEKIGVQAAASLKELESHYYSSIQRTSQTDM